MVEELTDARTRVDDLHRQAEEARISAWGDCKIAVYVPKNDAAPQRCSLTATSVLC